MRIACFHMTCAYFQEENKQYKHQLTKLQKQKKCYEEVVVYFREEMTMMSDQLQNLQELLVGFFTRFFHPFRVFFAIIG